MIKRFFQLLFKLALSFFLISIVWVFVYKFIPVPVTATMIWNSLANVGTDGPIIFSKEWKSLEDISKNAALAVIASEDQKFNTHKGFDIEAIKSAYKNNSKGKKIKGGSTISQQTAKNAFLWQGRSWIRKGLEAYFTVLIELVWGKKRIMEVYLNIAEMGNGIYGIEAASQKYFGKSAKHISASDAALIAAILPSPKKYSASNPGPYVRKRQSWITRQMRHVSWEYQ